MAHSSAPSSDDIENEKNAVPQAVTDGGRLENRGALPAEDDSDSDSSHHDRRRNDDNGDDDEGAVGRRSADAASLAGRIVSRITTRSSVAPSPPPDGGFQAWMVGEFGS